MVLGTALFYAWDLYGIYCGSVISSAPLGGVPHLSVIVNGAAALVCLVSIACGLYRLRAFYAAGLAVSVVTGLATPVGLLAIALGADPALVRLVVEALGRIGGSWVIVSWGAQFACLDSRSITVNTLCAFALALPACLVLVFSPYPVRVAFVSLALPASMALLVRARRSGGIGRAPVRPAVCSETFIGLTWRVIVVFFLFGIVTWVTIMSNRTEADASSLVSTVVIIAGSMAVVLALLAVALRRGGALTKSYTYKVVLPLIMSGVLLMGVASVSTALSWPLISIGYTCFDLFCFTLYANACRRTGANALRAYAWCRAVEGVAPVAALGVMAAFRAVSGNPETLFLDLVVPAAIFAVLAMIALDQDDVFEGSRRGADAAVTYPQAEVLYFARQCQAVIGRYALSPREAEVLSLIVRGRSVPHISRRLGISASTTKTHISHIYEKLDVCDRQEMIDLIESTDPGKDAAAK